MTQATLANPLTDAELAAALVKGAGKLALDMRHAGLRELRESASIKTGASDFVTKADIAAETFVVEQLRLHRPEDSILGEEGAAFTGTSGRTWVIDPVDGTFNFAAGSSYWCSALALCGPGSAAEKDDAGQSSPANNSPEVTAKSGGSLDDAAPLLGAVYQPEEDKLWLGGVGLPSTLNGQNIRVDQGGDPALVSSATYLHPGWVGEPRAALPWQQAAKLPATLRMLGSGSCDLSRVAQAEIGAWFQHSCPAWDWLPGKAIVLAAGGQTKVVEVNELSWFVAGSAGVVDSLVAALEAGQI